MFAKIAQEQRGNNQTLHRGKSIAEWIGPGELRCAGMAHEFASMMEAWSILDCDASRARLEAMIKRTREGVPAECQQAAYQPGKDRKHGAVGRPRLNPTDRNPPRQRRRKTKQCFRKKPREVDRSPRRKIHAPQPPVILSYHNRAERGHLAHRRRRERGQSRRPAARARKFPPWTGGDKEEREHGTCAARRPPR